MASAEVLKRKRAFAKGRFTRAVNTVTAAIEDINTDIATIKSMYDDVNIAWKNVVEKHEEYISVIDLEQQPDSELWITEVQTRYNDIRQTYNRKKIQYDNNVLLGNARRSRDVSHESFLHLCTNVDKMIVKDCTSVSLERERSLIKQQFDEVKRYNSELSLLLDAEDKSSQEWLTRLIENYSKLNDTIDVYVKKLAFSKRYDMPKIQLEKIPLPKFNGDIRSYPRFKRDFVELVMPTLNNKEASFVLRQCLNKDLNRYFESCGDDVDLLLKRLDEKFGDPSKMTDVIINDIKKFKSIESHDIKKLIEFINLIEIGYNDLKILSLQREISNANILSTIEGKLPASLALEWYREIHKPDSKVDKYNKFPSLLDFLRIERNALEYGAANIRISDSRFGKINYLNSKHDDGMECIIHKVNSHRTVDCRKYTDMTVRERMDVLRDNFGCYRCLSPGHLASNCVNYEPCVDGCDKMHHISLHDSVTPAGVYSIDEDNSCLLQIMEIPVKSEVKGTLNVFWDSGSTVSLILNSKAKLHKLKGIPVSLTITTVGGVEKKECSRKYRVPLIDSKGCIRYVMAYGINRITSDISCLSIEGVINSFNMPLNEVKRPCGTVDVLIGFDYAAWHPVKEQSIY